MGRGWGWSPARRCWSCWRNASPPTPALPREGGGRNTELILVGAIAGAFGVRGEVRVRSFTAAPEGVVSYGPLYDAAGRVVMTPKRWREIADGLAVNAPEIPTRDVAEKLKSTSLHVPRHLLPPAEEDEFYHVDLIGCRVETLAGEAIGEVIEVRNFGADDLLEIRETGGKTRFIEFSKADVPVVDLANRRVVAVIPEETNDTPEGDVG